MVDRTPHTTDQCCCPPKASRYIQHMQGGSIYIIGSGTMINSLPHSLSITAKPFLIQVGFPFKRHFSLLNTEIGIIILDLPILVLPILV
ncbi:hypothetical protein GDO81_012124 [Engystomops pustulosus]|uniref:Uncharacterized protein n=1 Tax=Engystomops pustulosus TaxID=76066 RepID=A0AAV7BJX6_ENGPU|nr:hypothetical protein GDO81_012124 [Engystomops pustulosus]